MTTPDNKKYAVSLGVSTDVASLKAEVTLASGDEKSPQAVKFMLLWSHCQFKYCTSFSACATVAFFFSNSSRLQVEQRMFAAQRRVRTHALGHGENEYRS